MEIECFLSFGNGKCIFERVSVSAGRISYIIELHKSTEYAVNGKIICRRCKRKKGCQ